MQSTGFVHSRLMRSTLAVSLLALIAATIALGQSPPQAAAPAVVAGDIEKLTWMQGTWVLAEQAGGDGGHQRTQYFEETWSEPRGDSMAGMFRWLRNDDAWMYELMTIQQEGETLVFRLRHFDRALKPWETEGPLTYPLKSISDNEVVFEDPQHDDPRRFVYARSGDKLTVRLESAAGKADSFTFTLRK